MDDPLPVLRQAAAALLATAPLAVVRATLRALLAEESDEQPAAKQPGAQVRTATPAVPRPQGTEPWDVLRRQVRAAMKQRRVDFAELGRQARASETTLRKNLARRAPASRALTRRLETWLAKAPTRSVPEVATEPASFRGNGNGTGAGAGTSAGTTSQSSAAAPAA